MIDAKVRAAWDAAMKPVGERLARVSVSPNALTFAGVALSIIVAVAVVRDLLLVAGLAAIVAAAADALDGAVAKAGGRVSRFGAVLDSTTDRLSDALLFLPVAWLYGVSPPSGKSGQEWVAAAALVTVTAAFLVSYVRARAEGIGLDAKVGIAERAERLIIVILALLFDVLPGAMVILAVLTTITFVQRLLHVRAQSQRAS
ncbi:CDP-alcohol phosphatidyltransferase family protein [soil metagenome]